MSNNLFNETRQLSEGSIHNDLNFTRPLQKYICRITNSAYINYFFN